MGLWVYVGVTLENSAGGSLIYEWAHCVLQFLRRWVSLGLACRKMFSMHQVSLEKKIWVFTSALAGMAKCPQKSADKVELVFSVDVTNKILRALWRVLKHPSLKKPALFSTESKMHGNGTVLHSTSNIALSRHVVIAQETSPSAVIEPLLQSPWPCWISVLQFVFAKLLSSIL